jgi:DNA-binding beta-propeller fold protein YncE
VSGILVVPDLKKVFGGSPNGLVIADVDPNSPTAYTPLAYVYLGPGGSDELDYDPVNRKVLITDPPDNIVGDVDAIHNTLIKTFTGLGAELEEPRYNPGDGMMYETVRGVNMLYKFNLANDTLVSQTPVGMPCRPNGLAIKPTTGLALLGCSTRDHLIFWDLKSNSIASTSAQDGGADVVLYNATADRFFAATGGFHLGPAMGMYDGSGNFITNVPTTFASHEAAYDQTNRMVYTIGGGLVSFTLPR